MKRPVSRWAVLAVLFAALVLADQWTKYLAVERLTTAFEDPPASSLPARVRAFYGLRHLEPLATEPYYVVRPLWRMNYVENPNAAFGLGGFLPAGPRHAAFLVFACGAVVAVLWYYGKLGERQRLQQVTLALILAGAVGNVVDRLVRQYVIDFVEWYWWNRPDLRWPTFNLADSLIVVGVAMLVLHPGSKREAANGAPGREKEQARAV